MKSAGIALSVLLFFVPAVAVANVIQYNEGGYNTPTGWSIIASHSVDANGWDHGNYFRWRLEDIAYTPSAVNIVLHGIRDWLPGEVDQIAVYLQDSSYGALGWTTSSDSESTTSPNWSSYSYLGLWSDPTTSGIHTYDVVYTIPLDSDRAIMADNDLFRIGIDPDCHYFLDMVTIEAAPQSTPPGSQVPEPTTLVLVGLGLVGLLGVRKRLQKTK
jgi:hypothetical protein